jgi:hypothetical protein
MKAFARQLLERALTRFDYRLVDVAAQPAGLHRVCDMLKARGFAPRTVIDVGVGGGTPWLYAAFPSARFELFEPIDTFRPLIEKAAAGLDHAVHCCALGEQAGISSIGGAPHGG